MNTNINSNLDIIPQQELLNLLGYKSPESLRTLLKRDETAPKPFKPSGRKVFFVRSEVESWLESKKASRG
ncbi:helix-turn-helix transcriptional regulator [Orbus mooreae]|uniref:helix-turn-helix transcriptional regulator n=1 Tax=Orbus mooreae TaxID=3074107 RepID=UPI00370DD3CF